MRIKTINPIFLLTLIVAFCVYSCKNDATSDGQTKQGTAAASGKLDMITKFKDGQITVEGKSNVSISAGDSSLVLFLAPPAQAGANLDREGLMVAERLMRALNESKLDQIYVKNNASLQTANLTSQILQCPLGLTGNQSTKELARFLEKNYKGKKVLVVAPASYLTELMQHFSGNNTVAFPEGVYNHLYVLTANTLGDGKVLKFQY